MADIDGIDAVRAAMDRRTARQLDRVQRAFSVFCREHLPPRLAVIVANQLLREQLDRLDEVPSAPGGKSRRWRESPADGERHPP
jgi:hypothetical protein